MRRCGVVLETFLLNDFNFQENRMALSGLWHLGREIKGVVVKKGATAVVLRSPLLTAAA